MRIIGGKYGRRRFDVPRNITARPTTDFARENLFNVLNNIIDLENKSVLDLFAGTGAMSIEFLSRGCRPVVAVEQHNTQVTFIHKVLDILGDSNLKVIRGDVFKYLSSPRGSFDIIFADPPYDHPRFGEIPELVLKSGLLAPDGIFIMEHSSKYDFSDLPGFMQHRQYGSVNFTIIHNKPVSGETTRASEVEA